MTALLAVLVAFGIDLDTNQQNAILGALVALWAIVTPLLIRGRVFAPDTTQELIDQAHRAGQAGDVPPKVTV